jgi:redox-sensitive bicupin YhaK (pirin superfamily)
MARKRKIRPIIRSIPTIEGAGVHLKRVFGFREVREFDPFLLLDDFRSNEPQHYLKGFPWHPHRGIETITYVLNGSVKHRDSMGNQGVIGSGDVQWMTAGSGIIHEEMPEGDLERRMGGFQLWANLPASHKMMDPRYREVKSSDIPEVAGNGDSRIRIISGKVQGTQGPVRDIVTDPEYLDIRIPPHSEFVHRTPPDHTVLAYIIEGQGLFCSQDNPFSYEVEGKNYFDMDRSPFVSDEELVLFDAGDQITVATAEQPVRFLLLTGKPIGEPIAWYGPIVMNTQEELRIAFEEFNNGTFVKYKSPPL